MTGKGQQGIQHCGQKWKDISHRLWEEIQWKGIHRKNPDAIIIDASDKIIMPGFFNSKLISSYSSVNIFFRKNAHTKNINSWLSLKLTDRFLLAKENSALQNRLFRIAHTGISFERGNIHKQCSSSITKGILINISVILIW